MSSSWTPQPRSRGVVMHSRYGMQSAVIALCVLLLAGCGQSSTPSATPVAGETAAVSAPPGADNRPAPLGSTGTAKDANGLPVLAPRGVNASQLFAQKLSDPDDRIDRLETAVQEMRNDFDAMAPSIVRLVAVEKDIQELVTQLETLVAGDAVAPVESQGIMPLDPEIPTESPIAATHPAGVQSGADGAPLPLSDELPVMAEGSDMAANPATPAPLPPATAPAVPATSAPPAAPTPVPAPAAQSPPPAPAAAGISVTALRTGEHPGKTRIVLDLSGKTEFTADLDNAEKILVVDLPGAAWSAATKKTFDASSRLASYEVNPGANGKGSLLVIKLRSDTAILYKGVMPADSGAGSKIVIDIGPGASASVPTN